jgi:translocation and assembly module TamB
VPLAWAKPFLPPAIEAEGRAELAVRAALPEPPSAAAWPAAVADVALQLPPGRLRYTTGGKTLELPHEGLQLDAVLHPGASLGPGRGTAALPEGSAGPEAWAGLEGVVRLGDGHRIAIAGRLPEPPDRADPLAAPLEARVAVGVEGYRLPQGLVPGVTAIRGGVQSDLRLRGSLARPRIDGHAQLTGAIDGIEALGVDVPGYELTLTGRGDRLTLAGWIDSESGRLHLDGQVALEPEQGWPARVRLRGERVRVANRMEYRASISPDLRIETSPERIAVQGELAVPRLLLEPRRLPKGAQRPSEDIVIVDNATDPAADPEVSKPLPLDLDLRLRLGDRVRFRGFGLDAELGGDLRLIQKPHQDPLATGQLTIRRGTYQAYGQDLTVRDGRILYAGTPVDNPGLDLRATRTLERDDVTVGAHVTGVAQDPKITLFSEPTLGQADILAYLVTGRPLRQASQAEGEQLSAAATALGAAGGLLAQDIRRRFGFETLEFEGGEDLATSGVVLGRYLTPRLYLSYGLNLRGKTERVGFEYQLDEHWTLETSTGQDQTGGDLIYTIEVD